MLSLLDRVSRRLVRRGLRQGLLEGSALWLVAGALAWLFRLLASAERPKVVREDIALGESIVVAHVPAAPTRREVRKASRSEGRQIRKASRSEGHGPAPGA